MRRVVVIGQGIFGAALVDQLRASGIEPLWASRHSRELRIDVEDPESLAAGLRADVVVVDAVGRFAGRSTALIECAIQRHFDVVDLNENLDYALAVQALDSRVKQAGIRVMSSCSSISVLTHALVAASGIEEPLGVSVLLRPASAEVASAGTIAAALELITKRPRILRAGKLVSVRNPRRRVFRLGHPLGKISADLIESADAAWLPSAWPGIQEADFWLNPGVPGASQLIALAIRLRIGDMLARIPEQLLVATSKLLGTHRGVFAVETRGARSTVVSVLWAPRLAHCMAVAPAALAAAALARGEEVAPGVVAPEQQVSVKQLAERLCSLGVHYCDSLGRDEL